MESISEVVGLLAVTGLAQLFSRYREYLFPTSVIVEAARLAALGEKLHECTEKAQAAWQSATGKTAEAEGLLQRRKDPNEISRVNLEVNQCLEDAKRAHAAALALKAKVKAKIAYMKVKYGDVETSRRAVEKARALLDQVQEIENKQEESITRQLHNTGTWELLRQAATSDNGDADGNQGTGLAGVL